MSCLQVLEATERRLLLAHSDGVMTDIHVDECTAALTSALACGVCEAAVSACALDDSTSAASSLTMQSAASAAQHAAPEATTLHQRVAFAAVLLDALGAVTQRAAAQWPASHILNPRYYAPSMRGAQPLADSLAPEAHARAQRQVDGLCALALALCAPALPSAAAPQPGSCGTSRSGSGLGLLPRLLFVLALAHDASHVAYDRPAPSASCGSWSDLVLRAEHTRGALISLVRACRYVTSVQEAQMQDAGAAALMPSSLTVTGKRVRAR